jgi:hypothetical protein
MQMTQMPHNTLAKKKKTRTDAPCPGPSPDTINPPLHPRKRHPPLRFGVSSTTGELISIQDALHDREYKHLMRLVAYAGILVFESTVSTHPQMTDPYFRIPRFGSTEERAFIYLEKKPTTSHHKTLSK